MGIIKDPNSLLDISNYPFEEFSLCFRILVCFNKYQISQLTIFFLSTIWKFFNF